MLQLPIQLKYKTSYCTQEINKSTQNGSGQTDMHSNIHNSFGPNNSSGTMRPTGLSTGTIHDSTKSPSVGGVLMSCIRAQGCPWRVPWMGILFHGRLIVITHKCQSKFPVLWFLLFPVSVSSPFKEASPGAEGRMTRRAMVEEGVCPTCRARTTGYTDCLSVSRCPPLQRQTAKQASFRDGADKDHRKR